jgi:hypothetical protein
VRRYLRVVLRFWDKVSVTASAAGSYVARATRTTRSRGSVSY